MRSRSSCRSSGAHRHSSRAAARERRVRDEHLLVIDKPAGLVVHPGAGTRSGTLVNALLHRVPAIRSVAAPTARHRPPPRQGHLGAARGREERPRPSRAGRDAAPPRRAPRLPRLVWASRAPPRARSTLRWARSAGAQAHGGRRRDGRPALTRWRTRERFGVATYSRCGSRRGAPTRSGAPGARPAPARGGSHVRRPAEKAVERR